MSPQKRGAPVHLTPTVTGELALGNTNEGRKNTMRRTYLLLVMCIVLVFAVNGANAKNPTPATGGAPAMPCSSLATIPDVLPVPSRVQFFSN